MNQANALTLDQEFSLRLFTDQIKHISCEQAQKLLIEQHRLMLVQQKTFQEILKHEWKLDLDNVSL